MPQARKRDAPSDAPTREEVDRTCYLCFEFSGKDREECYMKEVSGEYTTRHHGTKKGKGVVCKWFDDVHCKNASAKAVEERKKEAKTKRESARKKVARKEKPKKRARNPDDDAAAGKYTGNLPLLVINRPSLTDCL